MIFGDIIGPKLGCINYKLILWSAQTGLSCVKFTEISVKKISWQEMLNNKRMKRRH